MSEAIAGPLYVAAAVLGVAGWLKLRTPDPTARVLTAIGLRGRDELARALGVLELTLACAVVASPTRPLAASLAAVYLAFAAFVVLVLSGRLRVAGCGCFGSEETEPGVLHLACTLAGAAAAALAAASPPPALWQLLPGLPLAGVPFLLAVAAATGCAVLVLTRLPALASAYRGHARAAR